MQSLSTQNKKYLNNTKSLYWKYPLDKPILVWNLQNPIYGIKKHDVINSHQTPPPPQAFNSQQGRTGRAGFSLN